MVLGDAAGCLRHPGLPTEGRCARCGAGFCGTCRVEALAAEQVFCSRECRDLEGGVGRDLPADTSELARGVERPIRMGWSLTLRSLPELTANLLPLAIALAVLLWYGDVKIGAAFANDEVVPSHLSLAGWALFGFGAALSGVLLTRAHTGFSPGNPYLWTLRRFVPWALTWAIAGAAVLFGTLLLVIPGLWLGIRLFWADEFVLVLESGPLAALRESWSLTRGHGWRIFSFQFVLGLVEYLIVVPGLLAAAAIHSAVSASGFADHPLVEVSVSTVIFLIAFVTYAAAHASEVIYFYGLRAVRLQGGSDAPGV